MKINFKDLVLSMPEKLEEVISHMENGIKKQLLFAALRRIINISTRTSEVKVKTADKLHQLLARVEDNPNLPTSQQA